MKHEHAKVKVQNREAIGNVWSIDEGTDEKLDEGGKDEEEH